MFSQLPKLFDRDFAIGYFLPVTLFLLASIKLLNAFGFFPQLVLELSNTTNVAIGTSIIVLISWFGAVLLLSINREIYRMMEGYGPHNPVQLFAWIERNRYKKLQQRIAELNSLYRDSRARNQGLPPAEMEERNQLMQESACRFPKDETWLLPTAFGNIIRAFEVYPSVMYGIDSIPGWYRIVMVIPKEMRNLVDAAKAQTDFWVNLYMLSLAFVVESIGISIYLSENRYWWVPLTAFFAAWFVWVRAKGAAIEWGELVKATFDVFLPKLRKEMQLKYTPKLEKEQKLWKSFTQAILYQLPEQMPSRAATPPVDDKGK